MKSRPNGAVYWPSINNNIQNVPYTCHFCNEIAPQQPKEPIIITPIPQYPFQQICADYFEMSDHHYLSIVDRFSGLLNMYHYPPNRTIADTLISTCHAMFMSYRIPEELSTDGGPQFMSPGFQNFLTKWEVTHRLSSVDYP